jgi:ATP-binding cassette, subfamily B, bacterial
MITLIKEFWELIGRHRRQYLLAGCALVCATGFQLAFPWILKRAIDSVTVDHDWASRLFGLCTLLFIAALGEAVFTFLKGRWSAAASEGTIRDLRKRIFSRLMAMPFHVHNTFTTGDILQRSTSDIQTLNRFLGNQVAEVARTVCLLIGVSGFMVVMQPVLAGYALSILLPIFLFSLYFFGKIQNRFEYFDKSEAALSSMIQEHLTGIRVVKAFARETHERSQFDRLNREMVNQDIKLVGLHGIFWPLSDMLCMFQVVIVLLAGGIMTVAGDITLGTFVAFNSYVMLLVWPVRHVGRLLGEMGRASVSLHRIQEIENLPIEPVETDDHIDTARFSGHVGFSQVNFSYNGTRILENISFSIEPGQIVAVLGPTGSGKTTLVQLLTRFYDDYSGSITVDGTEIREISRPVLRSQIGLVMQESFLFSRSIHDNIAFGVDDVAEDTVQDAARIASVDTFVTMFPDGYKTVVGERGVTLSGGQKQRVSLARILMKNPSILILDDTTSALDTETEAEICDALRHRIRGGLTAFIVTHRLSTAAGADRILVLEDGKIVQDGTHEELILRKGYYRRLHDHQSARQNQLREEIVNEIDETSRRRISQAV